MDNNESKNMRNDLLRLVNIQTSLQTLQTLLSNKDDLANTLSDIWNTIIDYRSYVIENLLENKHMQIASLPEEFKLRSQ